MLGGPISVIFIARQLSLESQGVYYSILNLAVFQVWAEAGLTPLLINFSSHEASHLKWDSAGLAQAPSQNLQRLSQLTRLALYYFTLAAPILALSLVGLGSMAFGRLDAAQRVAVGPVWAAVVPAVCLRFTMTGLWAILEGGGRMLWVYRIRLADTILSLLFLWLGLHLGLGLYALPLSFWAGCGVQACAMFGVRKSIQQLLSFSPSRLDPALLREIWPLQWRLGLATVSGIVGSQFSSLLLYFRNASEAGQLGMTWSILAGGSALSGILIAARNPQQCALVARGEQVSARAYYRKTLLTVFALNSVIIAAGVGTVWCLQAYQTRWAARVLDVGAAALLGAGLVITWFTWAQSSWVRAHKQEPFLLISLLHAGAILAGIAWLAPVYGAFGLALAYASSSVFIVFPGTTYYSERLVAKGLADSSSEERPGPICSS